MDPAYKYQIENSLGRELTPDELVEVNTFDDLSRGQLDVVSQLESRRAGIAGGMYVRTVVPSARHSDVRDFVINIQEFIARKFPPPRFSMEHFYERELGRALADDERQPAESLEKLSEAQRAVARALSLKDTVFGVMYLGDIVKSARSYDRETFAENLRTKG
jgi:hypothetical protein